MISLAEQKISNQSLSEIKSSQLCDINVVKHDNNLIYSIWFIPVPRPHTNT